MRPGESRLEVYSSAAPRRRARARLPHALAAMLLLGVAFVSCAEGPEWTAIHRAPQGRTYGPGEYDKESVAVLGREALEKLGYERIMELAEQAGFVNRKPASELAQANKGMLAMDGAAAGRVFVRVFTKRAVAAGITSQLDSPAPGPADAVAVGILVLGLIEGGVAVYEEIQRSKPPAATTSAPLVRPAPVATATSKPTAGPVTTATSKPTADR